MNKKTAKQHRLIGIHRAMKYGTYHTGRLEKLTKYNPRIERAIYEYLHKSINGLTATRIAQINKISRATLYLKLKKYYHQIYKRQYKLNPLVQPFLRGYVGSKLNVLTQLENVLPSHYGWYIEAFVGSGALLFDLQPENAIINDTDPDVINSFKIVKNHPNQLIHKLLKYRKARNLKQQFYYFKKRLNHYKDDPITRASQFIALQAESFRGLVRNRNHSTKIITAHYNFRNFSKRLVTIIKNDSNYLRTNNIKILNTDFSKVLNKAKSHDFVFLDPPYSSYSSIGGLSNDRFYSHSFNQHDQYRLYKSCQLLQSRGAKFIESNSDNYYIRNLYQFFNIIPIKQLMRLNKKERKIYGQILIRNYGNV